MKTIILTSFLCLLLSSCASRKEIRRNVEFTITDKSIKDDSFINLLISNKTRLNYYLPIINSNERWKYMLSANENKFFFIYQVGYNLENEKRHWFSENCLSEIDPELDRLDELWKQKKKSIEVKDLILLKSGESVKITVPMNLCIKVSKDCTWELENYRNEKGLKIAINYPKKELLVNFLSSKTLDSLKQLGYELYDKEIISNKVPLLIEK